MIIVPSSSPTRILAREGGIITEEMKKTLKYFENLYRDEMNLENRYGEIGTAFVNNMRFYVTMLGGGFVFGSMVLSINRGIIFFIIGIGTFLLIFIMGVVLEADTAHRKLGKMDWEANEIERRRAELKGPVKKFQKQLTNINVPGLLISKYDNIQLEHAKSVVIDMVHLLESEAGRRLKEDQMTFLKGNLVVVAFYVLGVVALICFAF